MVSTVILSVVAGFSRPEYRYIAVLPVLRSLEEYLFGFNFNSWCPLFKNAVLGDSSTKEGG